MRIDISLLPALAATFMLVFARVGAMVMLLPGFGESNIPVRIKLAIALLLTLIILPLHRAAYQVDLTSMSSLGVLMVHEIVIGVVLGATARVTLSALAVAGSVIAQQLGLGFVTAVDPTGAGFLTAYPSGVTRPTASNLNFDAKPGARPNLVVVPLSDDGKVSLFGYAGAGTVDVIADVTGWFPDTPGFVGLTPARLLDTRAG